jgi:hypothetical protein
MASIKDLYTREDCNTPQRMTIGDQWIEVLGTDSDAFQAMRRQVNLDVIAGKLKPTDVERTLIASLVVGWSYDEPVTPENVQELLANAPSLADAIDRAASKRADFVGKQLLASLNTQGENSGQSSQPPKKAK